MPTILRTGPYRLYFYSHEPNEPPHIHVDRDDQSAKELRVIGRLVSDHEPALVEAWNEYFAP